MLDNPKNKTHWELEWEIQWSSYKLGNKLLSIFYEKKYTEVYLIATQERMQNKSVF